ncbi:MAG: redoxin domain-containing protein [Bacteroidia bacterium]
MSLFSGHLSVSLFIISLLLPFSTFSQGYQIKGTLANLSDGEIYLSNQETHVIIDTAVVNDGAFIFNGKLKEEPILVALFDARPLFTFPLDNAKISISGNSWSADDYQISGNGMWGDIKIFEGQFTPLQEKHKNIYQQKQVEHEAVAIRTQEIRWAQQAELQNVQAAYMEELKSLLANFIRTHQQSNALGWLLYTYYLGANDGEKMQTLWDLLPKNKRNDFFAQQYEAATLAANRWVNQPAIEVSAATPEGKMVNLSDFRGKYVLLDFWASWCRPCRKDNPELRRIYEQYHEKGLEIVGVSLDASLNDWLDAIETDQLPWVQISDLKGKMCEAAQMYEVMGIPFNVLINPQGIIIAQDLHGERLKEKLKTLLQ